jgi:hypothetical protein
LAFSALIRSNNLSAGSSVGSFLRHGFQNADRLSILKKKIVGIAGLEGELTDGNTPESPKIQFIIILNLPASQIEEYINILPGFFFRSHSGFPVLRKLYLWG